MIKHVGRHDNRRVAIIYKQVPGEDHMCLVAYTETLPAMIHDECMKVLESEVGQNAKDLADALFRHLMADGENALVSLHRGGFLKKVQTKQVIVTANASSSIRLDELNKILDQMAGGEEAVKRLADLDANAGVYGNRDLIEASKTSAVSVNTTSTDALSDADLAKDRLAQANKLKAEAQGLLAEAKRLETEAKSLVPQPTKKPNVRTTKKAVA
jgi:hypothetical protein